MKTNRRKSKGIRGETARSQKEQAPRTIPLSKCVFQNRYVTRVGEWVGKPAVTTVTKK